MAQQPPKILLKHSSNHRFILNVPLPPKDVVQTQTDNRPILTDKQAESAIKKINNKQVDLQQIVDYYIISEEQLNYIKAKTEVLEHDPV